MATICLGVLLGMLCGASAKKTSKNPSAAKALFGELTISKIEAWGRPGGSWGRPGGHLTPKTAQSTKNIARVTWRTPPWEPNLEPNRGKK